MDKIKTLSVCPICLKQIEAYYEEKNNKVYLLKTCSEHGHYETLAWSGSIKMPTWQSGRDLIHETEISGGCPESCGICESHHQKTCCVLLEITHACNLKCPICFASSGENENSSSNPDLAEIETWYKMLLENGGPFNIQLSGGEPTLREDLAEIIKLGKNLGFDFFQLNTNGIKLAENIDFCLELKEAGLNCVFLQFDGLKDTTYVKLRGKNLIDIKMKAIDNCKQAGIAVVLVPTIVSGINDNEIGTILDFALSNLPYVKGVHFQPASYFGRYPFEFLGNRLTMPELIDLIDIQTEGKMPVSAFIPPASEHPLCSFNGRFAKKKDGSIKTLTQFGKMRASCCSGNNAAQDARKYVARNWTLAKESLSINKNQQIDISSLDSFLEESKYTLTVSGMVFQDAWSLDLNRLKYCHIHVVSKDNKLVPFCAYNLTASNGHSHYRNK